MFNFILIFVCLLLGIILQNIKVIPIAKVYKILNKIVVTICMPAIVLFYIPKLTWSNELLYPIGSAWISFIVAFVLFYFLGKKYGWSNKMIGCLVLTAGLGNTSFLGYPIISALYGEQGLKMAILVDQPGTVVVLSTLGILVATYFSKDNLKPIQMLVRVLKFPPFVCFLIACFLNVFLIELHYNFQLVLKVLASAMAPLALTSVGMQLRFESKSQHWRFLGLGLLYKLILTPILIFTLYVLIFKQKGSMIEVVLMESAMASNITASILATSYGLKPRLASMMIGYGIPLSFITLVFWYFVTQII
ncbi:AEC family transporter [Flavobacterium algicola]|uniref:AEC family transporter n=1 Tax=Flavobacterium algicola TaxID=556529 RepID=UPI001EFE023E|nr:AEC family transporter [Flavobacterium algicola]MCG9793225.1 AEC family transporter [Flavobacterium algicola]